MKRKTKQAAAKRFKISSTGKVQHRKIGQAHFNSRNSGQETRGKHHNVGTHPANNERLLQLLPYKAR